MLLPIGLAVLCLSWSIHSHGVVYRRVAHSKYPNIWAECQEDPTKTEVVQVSQGENYVQNFGSGSGPAPPPFMDPNWSPPPAPSGASGYYFSYKVWGPSPRPDVPPSSEVPTAEAPFVVPPPPVVSENVPAPTTALVNEPILPSMTNEALAPVAPSPSPNVVLPETPSAPPVSNDPNIPYVDLPSGFPGVNTGIASWFRANNPQDSSNGNSWCGYPYNDDMPGMINTCFIRQHAKYSQ
jgi:hypothetical protein